MYNLNNKLLKLPKDGSALMSGRSFFPLTLAIKKSEYAHLYVEFYSIKSFFINDTCITPDRLPDVIITQKCMCRFKG